MKEERRKKEGEITSLNIPTKISNKTIKLTL